MFLETEFENIFLIKFGKDRVQRHIKEKMCLDKEMRDSNIIENCSSHYMTFPSSSYRIFYFF
jgi:hypothetical protein